MRQQSGTPRIEKNNPNDFSDLNISESLKKGIRELGYVSPTEFQKSVFDHFVHGKNVVGEGQSNYGKSLAFSLPILSKIKKEGECPQALIVCENFNQSDLAMKECRALGRHLNISVENISTCEKWLPTWPQVVVASFDDFDKLKEMDSLDTLHTVFFDALSEDQATKIIAKLEPLLKKNLQIMIFGNDTLNAFKTHASEYIEDAAFVNNSDQPKKEEPALHIVHQAKEDEPKPRALLATLLHHKPKSALVSCNEAAEAELLARFLTRYGYKTIFSSEEHNRHAVSESLNLLAGQKVDVFICQNSLLAGQNLSAIPFMVNFDMIERPQNYEHYTQFNKQASGLRRTIVNLLSSRELGYQGPIKAQCLIDFQEMSLPSGEEVLSLAASRIIGMLNEDATQIELGQFEALAQKILEHKEATPALALLLRNHFLKEATRPQEQSAPRERPSYQRRSERREERPERSRPSLSEAEQEKKSFDNDEEAPGNASLGEGSTRLYVTLGKQDGLEDLASLAQYLSEHAGVDLGHFSGTGMLREHSAHIEVDNDVVDQIIKAIHESPRPHGTSAAEHDKGNVIICERARQAPERKFHRPQQNRRGNFPRRRFHNPH